MVLLNRWVVYCVVFAVAFPIVYLLTPSDSRDLDRFQGTWTLPTGPAGNSLEFYMVQTAIPGSVLDALEGHIRIQGFNGWADGRCDWGYESFEPLRLNLSGGAPHRFAAIMMIDDDHLQIRFGDDITVLSSSTVFNSPDTLVLHRVPPLQP